MRDGMDRIAVIGGGTMGRGIAICALNAGMHITLVERGDALLAAALEQVAAYYRKRVAAGKSSASDCDDALGRLAGAGDLAAIAAADVVIEAIHEDLDAKLDLFRRLGAAARDGALLATNTSYLDVDAIAGASGRPDSVIGLHFFSPAPVMKLVEVVMGAQSSVGAIERGMAVAQHLGKLPVLARNSFGFIGNRIFSAYRRQCEFMLEEGALPRQIDDALESMGMAMGPFAVADLSGLDVAWRMRQARAARRDPSHRYVTIPDTLCELGRLGRKTGAGYYAYGPEGEKRADPRVQALIEAASAAKGMVRRHVDAAEIRSRCLAAMVNEAAHVLREGTALRAADIDTVLQHGYGFPRALGGPVQWARTEGLASVERHLDRLEQASGCGFARAELSVLFGGHDAPAPAEGEEKVGLAAVPRSGTSGAASSSLAMLGTDRSEVRE